MKENRIVKDAVILTVIALLLSVVLGFVNEITKDKIAEQNELKKQNAYAAVYNGVTFESSEELDALVTASEETLTAAGFGGVVINEAMTAVENGEPAGYVLNITTANGYGGDIDLAIGVTAQGKMTGLSIISNSETAGLGANCSKASFTDQFAEIDAEQIEFTKSGKTDPATQIDAISSATITTTAVTGAVNAGLHFVYNEIGVTR